MAYGERAGWIAAITPGVSGRGQSSVTLRVCGTEVSLRARICCTFCLRLFLPSSCISGISGGLVFIRCRSRFFASSVGAARSQRRESRRSRAGGSIAARRSRIAQYGKSITTREITRKRQRSVSKAGMMRHIKGNKQRGRREA